MRPLILSRLAPVLRAISTATMLVLLLLNGTVAQVRPTAEEKCQAGKNKLAGAYGACLANAEAKRATTKDVAKYTTALDKCKAKFSTGWLKLEANAAKGGATCLDGPTTVSEFLSVIAEHASRVATALAGGPLQICPQTPNICDAPSVIPSTGGAVSGSVSGDSGTSGAGRGCGGAGPEEVFQWTPSVSGMADLRTCGFGTTFVSDLYVRSGQCLAGSNGTQVTCNDSSCLNGAGPTGGKIVQIQVVANETYFIFVDSEAGASGTFSLQVSPPGSCESPRTVPASGGSFTVSTIGSRSTLTGSCGGSGGEIVFTWTPNFTGTALANTCLPSTDFNTVVYVRDGACGGGELACQSDQGGACGNRNYLEFPVTSGHTYAIVVDGYSGAQGTFTLALGEAPIIR